LHTGVWTSSLRVPLEFQLLRDLLPQGWPDEPERRLEPAPGDSSLPIRPSWRLVSADSLQATWSNGLFGVGLRLHVTDTGLA